MKIVITYRNTSRLRMRIVKNGDVHVSAPRGMSRADIDEFINNNREWIAESKKKNFEQEQQRAEFYNQLPLRTRAECDDAVRRLTAFIEPMVERHAKEMNVKPSSIYYKANTSTWGKCNTEDRSICFSAYVLLLPEWCVEHVVVHELCHLLEPSHNDRFHALMDRYFPHWREARKETRHIARQEE